MGAFLNVRLIRTASKLALLFQRRALRPNGLSVQDWRVLINVARLGNCHLRELSRIATTDAGHASRSTKTLESQGLISRYPDPDDGRRTRLTLTPEGHAMVDLIWPMALDLNRQINDAIGADRMHALCDALDRTREFVTDDLGSDGR